MKNRIITNSIRNIFKSFPRFISLLVMSALGVFTFAGLQATAPDMISTLDVYLDSNNVYDVQVISDMGLTDDDLNAISELESVESTEGSKFKQIVALTGSNEHVISVHQLPENMNAIKLTSGTMPVADNEIIVEENLLTKEELAIGDSIVFEDEGFVKKEAIITGTVSSPLYYNNVKIEQNRGNTGVGTGIIAYYAYMPKEAFDMDVYTVAYITVNGAKEVETGSQVYESKIAKMTEELESIKDERQNARRDSIIKEANDEISENEAKADKELGDAKKELDDAKSELDESKTKLEDADKEITSNRDKLNSSKAQLDNAKAELDAGERSYNAQNEEFKKGEAEFEAALKSAGLTADGIAGALKEADNGIESLKKGIADIDARINSGVLPPEQVEQLKAQKKGLEAQLTDLQGKRTNLQKLSDTKTQIDSGRSELQAARAKLDSSKAEYEQGLAEYNSGVVSLESAQAEYDDGMKELEDGEKKYEDGLKEYTEKEADARDEIQNAKDELKDIKTPSWYINDRRDYLTYSDYLDDASSIANLSKVFPFLFFLVAILISLISMNRMVEDDRMEIGTLKSLGFSNGQIISKYVMFSLLATLIGAVGGAIAGLIVLPEMIFGIYKILFDIPGPELSPRWGTTLIGVAITVACVAGSGILTAYAVLKEKPASLMRPKAPRMGKRVLLERIPLFWNRLNFSGKITVRNLFRYKKRVFVTIAGIAGCTALILIGFGMKDSIVDIPSAQFDEIYNIDGMAFLNTDDKDDSVNDFILEKPEIVKTVSTAKVSADVSGSDVYFVVAENQEDLGEIVILSDSVTGERLSLEPGKVVITEKLARIKKLSVGDTIDVKDINNNTYSYPISGIAKNYFDHYIYLDDETFNEYSTYEPNLIYFTTNLDTTEEREQLSEELLKRDSILSVTYKETLIENADNMLQSLNSVVFILIILAAMLAFVVLYNLSNININERKRELATLKVLGFYNHEVDSYITRENVILTIIGIGGGLILGFFMTSAVVSTIEIEKARFMYRVLPQSFIFASLISVGFTLIVNFITHFNLKKINMIESLKSVE